MQRRGIRRNYVLSNREPREANYTFSWKSAICALNSTRYTLWYKSCSNIRFEGKGEGTRKMAGATSFASLLPASNKSSPATTRAIDLFPPAITVKLASRDTSRGCLSRSAAPETAKTFAWHRAIGARHIFHLLRTISSRRQRELGISGPRPRAKRSLSEAIFSAKYVRLALLLFRMCIDTFARPTSF